MTVLITLLLALTVNVEPKILRVRVGDRIPIHVEVFEGEESVKPDRIAFRIIPEDLGHMEGDFFVGDRPGRGILFVRVRVGDRRRWARRLIEVLGSERIEVSLIPDFIKLMPGQSEELKLKLTPEPEKYRVEWKIVPGNIGKVEDMKFFASERGAGKLIAIVKSEKARGVGEADVLVGVPEEVSHDLKLVPEEAVLNVLDTLLLNIRSPVREIEKMEFFVFPPRVGKVEKDKFIATHPGRAEVWAIARIKDKALLGKATYVVEKRKRKLVEFDPPYIVGEPGEEELIKLIPNIVPRRLRRPAIVWEVEPKNLGEIKGKGMTVIFKSKKTGLGRIKVKLKRTGKVIGEMPVLVVKEKLRITPEKARIGEDDTLFLNIGTTGKPTLMVFPDDAGKVIDGKFVPSGLEDEAFIIAREGESGGISHILIKAEIP